jgi:hypothetical protein
LKEVDVKYLEEVPDNPQNPEKQHAEQQTDGIPDPRPRGSENQRAQNRKADDPKADGRVNLAL